MKSQNSCRILQPRSYDSHVVMLEIGKFNLKTNVIPNGLEKYMSFLLIIS